MLIKYNSVQLLSELCSVSMDPSLCLWLCGSTRPWDPCSRCWRPRAAKVCTHTNKALTKLDIAFLLIRLTYQQAVALSDCPGPTGRPETGAGAGLEIINVNPLVLYVNWLYRSFCMLIKYNSVQFFVSFIFSFHGSLFLWLCGPTRPWDSCSRCWKARAAKVCTHTNKALTKLDIA